MLYVDEDSKIAGKSLADVRKLAGSELRLLDVRRGSGVFLPRLPSLAFAPGDRLHLLARMSPTAVLGGLMLLMALLTNILSNNAAGIIGTPIAIGIAKQLGLAPEPFVIAIIAGVNLSFCTPMAYQTNLLVMHAGGYRFFDFVRIGLPLTALMWAGTVVVIPRFFPF